MIATGVMGAINKSTNKMRDNETSKTSSSTFKILAIDGGGFKGLYSACLLAELENRFGSIHKYFHMICGTSTGGLIALPLSIGKSAEEIVSFYKKHGQFIFPGKYKISRNLRMLRFAYKGSRYSHDPLKKGLIDILGDSKMSDSQNYLCIPSFSTTKAYPRVFKTSHCEDHTRDHDLLMWEVALATSAAPSYFPIATVNENSGEHYYLDGGVWANNPAFIGFLEAGYHFVGPEKQFDSLSILSLAQVEPPKGKISTNKINTNLLKYTPDLFDQFMEGQKHHIDNVFKFIKPLLNFEITYKRIYPDNLSKDQQMEVDLDIATDKAIRTLCEIGSQKGHLIKTDPDIAAFFHSEVTSQMRLSMAHTTP
jgi:uncharacterized protein